MPNAFYPGNSNRDFFELVFPDNDNIVCSEFVEYAFNSHFLTPADGWSFTLDSQARASTLGTNNNQQNQGAFDAKSAMKPGTKVELHLNGSLQCTGYIDSVEISASRSGGLIYRVEGRDAMAQAVDACADPTAVFKEGTSLEDALLELFKPFEFKKIEIDNVAEQDLKTNAFRAKTKKSDAKGFGGKAIKAAQLHQTRPYPREGVFEFASRLAQRFGLWIWPTADGQRIVVSTPDFTRSADCKIIRSFYGSGRQSLDTNVLSGSVKYDCSEQPTAIIADSYSKGGEFGPGRVKTIFKNAAVKCLDPNDPPYQKFINAGAVVVTVQAFPDETVMEVPRHRVLYLHDDESATQKQLTAFVLREMALLQRKSVTAKYTVEGHGQFISPDDYRSWAIDTTVEVRDEATGLQEIMYVLSRTFHKSREGGTYTDLELIRLNTLVFTDTGK